MSSLMEIRAPSEQPEGTRSQLLRWLKAIGDEVAENEPLIELETDKVTVEIASPGKGVLREILKQAQDEIEPGELLGRIEVGASAEAVRAAPRAPASGGSVAERERRHHARTGPAAARLSPAVRRLLAEHGLEPSAVKGS